MDTSIIIIIVALLIASVVGSIIFAKKEQAAALRKQQIASYRFRADEAQDLYDGLQLAGLENITYQFLLERIISNLHEAYNIDARAPGISVRLNSAKNALSNLENVQFTVKIPSEVTELHALIGRLNKLVKYLIVLFQKSAISEHQYSQLMPEIQTTLLRIDVDGHVKSGHQAVKDKERETAKQYYQHAKDKLINSDPEDAYVIAKLEDVEEFLGSLVVITTPDSTTAEVDENEEGLTQKELNIKNETDVNDVLKKKW